MIPVQLTEFMFRMHLYTFYTIATITRFRVLQIYCVSNIVLHCRLVRSAHEKGDNIILIQNYLRVVTFVKHKGKISFSEQNHTKIIQPFKGFNSCSHAIIN
ncbi:hypothetical protein LXL04_034338 [Taraxacum kok-saghyz]